MIGARRSFLEEAAKQAEQQPELFSVEAVAGTVEEAMAARGDFTAAGFFKRHPKAYLMVCALLASGLYGLREIAEMAGVSVNTIRAVQDNEPGKIDTLRKDMADRMRRTARKLVMRIERQVEDGEKMTVRDMAVAMGIMTQYSELLSGNATERIDVTGLDATKAFEAFREQLASMPVIDVTPTGVEPGNERTKGPAALGMDLDARGLQAPPPGQDASMPDLVEIKTTKGGS